MSDSLLSDKQKQLIKEMNEKWEPLKSIIDKYPQGFSLNYDPEKGYLIRLHLDYLVPREEVQV